MFKFVGHCPQQLSPDWHPCVRYRTRDVYVNGYGGDDGRQGSGLPSVGGGGEITCDAPDSV